MCLVDLLECEWVAQEFGIYQSYRGRSFIYLFTALPLISVYDGNFKDIASEVGALQSTHITIGVGLILLLNSVAFLLFSLCRSSPYPQKGCIAVCRRVDDDHDLPSGFEEEKSTVFDVEIQDIREEEKEKALVD